MPHEATLLIAEGFVALSEHRRLTLTCSLKITFITKDTEVEKFVVLLKSFNPQRALVCFATAVQGSRAPDLQLSSFVRASLSPQFQPASILTSALSSASGKLYSCLAVPFLKFTLHIVEYAAGRPGYFHNI